MDISIPPLNLVELWKIIMYNTKKYDDKNDIIADLRAMEKQNNEATQKFSDLIIQLTENISLVSDDINLKFYKNIIITTIKNNPKLIINTFIAHGYESDNGNYRKQLILCDDDYIMKNNFEEHTNGDDSLISKLFQFKSFWSKLSNENKQIIKMYIAAICYYADIKYINNYKYIEIKKINRVHKDIFAEYDNILK